MDRGVGRPVDADDRDRRRQGVAGRAEVGERVRPSLEDRGDGRRDARGRRDRRRPSPARAPAPRRRATRRSARPRTSRDAALDGRVEGGVERRGPPRGRPSRGRSRSTVRTVRSGRARRLRRASAFAARTAQRPSAARRTMSGPAAWSSRRPRTISSRMRPVAQDEDPVGVRRRLRVVGDEHDGLAALGAEAPEHVEDLRAGRVVEVAGRLVGEEEGRPVDEGPGEGHPLLLAGGELVGAVAAPCRPGRRPRARRGSAADSSRPPGSRPATMNGRATFSRTDRIGMRLKNWKTKPGLRPAQLRRRVVAEAADDRPVEDDLARRRAVEAAEQVEERALARARRPHDGDELAGLDRQRDAAHGRRRRSRPCGSSGRGRAPRGWAASGGTSDRGGAGTHRGGPSVAPAPVADDRRRGGRRHAPKRKRRMAPPRAVQEARRGRRDPDRVDDAVGHRPAAGRRRSAAGRASPFAGAGVGLRRGRAGRRRGLDVGDGVGSGVGVAVGDRRRRRASGVGRRRRPRGRLGRRLGRAASASASASVRRSARLPAWWALGCRRGRRLGGRLRGRLRRRLRRRGGASRRTCRRRGPSTSSCRRRPCRRRRRSTSQALPRMFARWPGESMNIRWIGRRWPRRPGTCSSRCSRRPP